MRRRSFTPEAVASLEPRALTSHAPGPARLSAPAYGLDVLLTRNDFQQFALYGNFNLLKAQLAIRAAPVPFSRVDGLGPKTNAILDQMERNLAAGVPGAIYLAYQQVIAGIHDEVQMHIDNGTLIVVQ